jgi:hypothetical protein
MDSTALDLIRTIATVGTAIVAIVTIIKGYSEYKLSSIQKRVELFEKYHQKLKENEPFKNILGLLETKNNAIKTVPLTDRYMFLGFYEEIALLVNSKVLKPEIAHYMFAYYANICWRSNDFWHDINRESMYWRIFREFVEQMNMLEAKHMTIPQNKKLRFKI